MCDNGFNSLGSPNIFHELRYREWMHEVWESYKFYVQKMKQDSRDNPDATLCLEKDDVLRPAYYKYAREEGHHPESYRVLKVLCMKDTLKANTYLFNVMLSPLKNVKTLKTISYLLTLERSQKMHAYQNALLCLKI